MSMVSRRIISSSAGNVNNNRNPEHAGKKYTKLSHQHKHQKTREVFKKQKNPPD